MGQSCSSTCRNVEPDTCEMSRTDSPDPVMYDLMRKSIQATTSAEINNYKAARRKSPGQNHLLYRNSKIESGVAPLSLGSSDLSSSPSWTPNELDVGHGQWLPSDTPVACPTRLLIRRRSLRVVEEGAGTHIYAIRYPEDTPDKVISEQAATRPESARQEQCPPKKVGMTEANSARTSSDQMGAFNTATLNATTKLVINPTMIEGTDFFSPAAMSSRPRQRVMDWVTVSEDHNIYVADVGLTALQCDYIVNVTEQVCRGQYAAYTYAKQTLGCREYPNLARTCFAPVHTVTSEIIRRLATGKPQKLQLDDREPHIVKYDVTKKERQKLDMHTDKSEWTFLIALSNGCGVDYEGGGTYFECLDATVHIQRGHALIFPGKLRHCGQKITSGLRFLLVGFLVDKLQSNGNSNAGMAVPNPTLASAPIPTTVSVKS